MRAWVKNAGLGFDVPYRLGASARRYVPDFIALVDEGRDDRGGGDDPLHLVVEIKGFRGEDAKVKKQTMDAFWVPGVNRLGAHGRWAFAELTDPNRCREDLDAALGSFKDLLASGPLEGLDRDRPRDFGRDVELL